MISLKVDVLESISRPSSAVHVDDVSAPVVILPSGRSLDLRRSRWDGILDIEEVAYCRTNGIALGYDPAQIGWVLLGSDPDATRVAPATCDHARPRRHAMRSPLGITFRRWSDDDISVHRAMLDDRSMWEHLPEPHPEPFTDDTSRDFIALANADIGHDVLAVEVDGKLVGQCLIRFDPLSARPYTAEVAYWLGREHWGGGLMSRVLPAFVDRCFDTRRVDELYAWIRPANVASARVAERAGFDRESLPNEAELAASQGRPGFSRWRICRTH
jgi:RimJ/RimL family protein N-acetyltransferase